VMCMSDYRILLGVQEILSIFYVAICYIRMDKTLLTDKNIVLIGYHGTA